MKYEIKHRFAGTVQFTAEINCDENESDPIKLGLAVKWGLKNKSNLRNADFSNAYLRKADFSNADFSNAYLGNANLSNADFRGANLGDSDHLISGGQRLDGYEFYGQIKDGELWIKAGCRYFSIDEARRHWNETRKDTTLGDETFLRLDMIESIAKTRFGEF